MTRGLGCYGIEFNLQNLFKASALLQGFQDFRQVVHDWKTQTLYRIQW